MNQYISSQRLIFTSTEFVNSKSYYYTVKKHDLGSKGSLLVTEKEVIYFKVYIIRLIFSDVNNYLVHRILRHLYLLNSYKRH